MAKGGITKGKSHKEGGIPMVVKSTGQKVELEGGEGVINKRNMADTKKHKFDGKELTKCEIVSEINEDNGNGVKIDCDDIVGRKYKYKKGGRVEDLFLNNYLVDKNSPPNLQSAKEYLELTPIKKIIESGRKGGLSERDIATQLISSYRGQYADKIRLEKDWKDYAKGGRISDDTYRELWYAHIGGEYDTMKNVKKDIHRLLKDEKMTMKELLSETQYKKGGRLSQYKTEVHIERYKRDDGSIIYFVFDLPYYEMNNDLSYFETKKDTLEAIRNSKEHIWRGSQLNTTEKDYDIIVERRLAKSVRINLESYLYLKELNGNINKELV